MQKRETDADGDPDSAIVIDEEIGPDGRVGQASVRPSEKTVHVTATTLASVAAVRARLGDRR